jgi:hypothetical protein
VSSAGSERKKQRQLGWVGHLAGVTLVPTCYETR